MTRTQEKDSKKERVYKFRPPMNNSFVIGAIRLFLPMILRRYLGVVAVEVRGDGLKRLSKLKGQRAILTPNHPSLDPHLIFHLSKLLGNDFNYLAAQEVFDKVPPVTGWFVQRLGAYSVIRGTRDMEAFDMTHKLLMEGKRWLVIFPEGISHWLHDVIMPFREGTARFAFKALDELAKDGAPPPLYLVPIADKYVFIGDMRGEIDGALRSLEEKLSLTSDPAKDTCFDRLRNVGKAVLSVNEKKYGVQPRPGAGLNERLQSMKELITANVAEKLGVELPPDQPLLGRMRALYNTIDRIVQSEPAASEYERKLQEREQKEARRLGHEVDRVMAFVALAVNDEDDEDVLTAERFLDVVGQLEVEVFGHRKIREPRKAYMQIGEPMNLADRLEDYRKDPQGTIRATTIALETAVREMLDGMQYLSKPLVM